MNLFSSLMRPKNKYSLENLKYLHSTLVKNSTITNQNSGIVVETLRQIAEVMIWGDQNNNTLFDFFLEKNLLGFFINILEQKTSPDVIIQLLQTLSILVENLRNRNSIFALFSNNVINEIIIHKFDFSNEEVLAYYVSLLKALSLKLDQNTINFFFNGQERDFPLYTEAIKFINHKETMIKIAVRTLTLNVFKVEDEVMRTYIINSTAVPYFSNIVWFIRQQCSSLNIVLEKSNHDRASLLNSYLEDLTDQFYYLHDIFNLGFDSMNLVLAEQFVQYLIFPQLIGSLLDPSRNPELEDRLTPALALFLISQVFHIFTYKPLLDTVASALVSPTPSHNLIISSTNNVTAPPPLTILSSQRTHYNSFRRISSFPNLESAESNSNNNSPKKSKKQSSTSTKGAASTTTTTSTNIININSNTGSSAASSSNNTSSTNSNQHINSPNVGSVGSANNNNTPPNAVQFGELNQSGGSSQHMKIVSDDEDNYNNDIGSNLSSPPSSPRGKQQLQILQQGGQQQGSGQQQQGGQQGSGGQPQVKRLSANFQSKLFAKSDLSSSLDSGSTNMSLDSQNDTQSSTGKRNSLKNAQKTKPRNEHKEMLLLLLNKDRETFGVVCMLYSLFKNPYIDNKILEIGGVLPYRLAKAKKLLQGLLSPESRGNNTMSSSLPANLNTSSHHRSKSESYALIQQQHQLQQHQRQPPSTKVSHDGIITAASRASPTFFTELDINNNNNNNVSPSTPTKISTSLTSSNLSSVAAGGSGSGPILRIFKSKEQIEAEENEQRELERLRNAEKEDEDQEFIPVPDSYQKEFTRDLIERIFYVLMNSNQFRLVTLQMTYLVLKELVYSSESPSKLTENQFEMLEEAYQVVVNNLKDCLSGSTAPIFLELFEDEMGSYKQIKFEMLLKEAALILPVPERPISRLSLARRLPSGEVEKTQKAIQQFLVLREMKYTLLRMREKGLPLKQPQYPIVREKEYFRIDRSMYDTIDYVTTSIKKPSSSSSVQQSVSSPSGSGSNSGSGSAGSATSSGLPTLQYSFVAYHNLLLNLDRNNVQPPPGAAKGDRYGIITHIAPLQRIEIEVSHLDPCILRVFSHPTTWGVDMMFDDEKKCLQAKSMLERARDDFRASKMRQIYALLGERDPDDDDTTAENDGTAADSDNTGGGGSARKKSLSKIFQPVDASNSHPLSFSGTDFVMTTSSGRKLSGSGKQIPTSTTSTTTTPTKNNLFSKLIDEDSDLGSSPKSTKRFSKENIFMSFLNDTDDTFLKEHDNNNSSSENLMTIMESNTNNNNYNGNINDSNNMDLGLNLNIKKQQKHIQQDQQEQSQPPQPQQESKIETVEQKEQDIETSTKDVPIENNNNSDNSNIEEQIDQINEGMEDIDFGNDNNNNNNNYTPDNSANHNDENDNQSIIVEENNQNNEVEESIL